MSPSSSSSPSDNDTSNAPRSHASLPTISSVSTQNTQLSQLFRINTQLFQQHLKFVSQFLLENALLLSGLELYVEVKEKYGLENALLKGFFQDLKSIKMAPSQRKSSPLINTTQIGTNSLSKYQTKMDLQARNGSRIDGAQISELSSGSRYSVKQKNTSSSSPENLDPMIIEVSQFGSEYIQSQITLRDEVISQLNYQISLLKSENAKLKEVSPHQTSSTKSEIDKELQDQRVEEKLEKINGDTLKEEELSELNELILQYLNQKDYSMSAIAFSEEASISSSKINEDNVKYTLENVMMNWKNEGPESRMELIREWNQKVSSRDQRIETLQNQLLAIDKKHATLQEKYSSSKEKIRVLQETILEHKNQIDNSIYIVPPSPSNNDTSLASEETSIPLSRKYAQVVHIMDSLVQNIPTLVTSLKVKHQHLLIPIISTIFENNDDKDVKSSMVATFFDMNKNPKSKEQRDETIHAIVVLAEKIGEEQTKEYILTFFATRIREEPVQESRFLLFSELLHQLILQSTSLFVNEDLLPLIQLLIDRCTIKEGEDISSSYRLLAKSICDTFASSFEKLKALKYNVIEGMIIQLLEDDIMSSVEERLLPLFVKWCAKKDLIFKELIPTFLGHISKNIELYRTRMLAMILKVFKDSLQHVKVFLESIPEENILAIVTKLASVDTVLDKESQEETTSVPPHYEEISLITNTIVPEMVMLLCRLDSSVDGLIRAIYSYIGGLCDIVTPQVKEIIYSRFMCMIHNKYKFESKEIVESIDPKILRVQVLILFISGPLFFDKNKEALSNFLYSSIESIVQESNGWNRKDLSDFISALKTSCRISKLQRSIINGLYNLIVHQEKSVKVVVCEIFIAIIPCLDEEVVHMQVLSSLITFGNDKEPEVRLYALEGLSEVVKHIDVTKDLDKIAISFDQFFENPSTSKRALQILANIIPNAHSTFRELYILKKLFQVATNSLENTDEMEREHLTNLLLSAYKALNGVSLTKSNLKDWIIPGLQVVEKIAVTLEDKHPSQEISRMIKDLSKFVPKIEMKSPTTMFGRKR